MLSSFPMPYPDEWWYSVLCRFYIRAGFGANATSMAVKQILFGEQSWNANMGARFPNACIANVINRLPEGMLSVRDVILKHTTFMYDTRFYPKRDEAILALSNGECHQVSHLWKFDKLAEWAPRYCPLCVRDDASLYGEPYWHVAHQIPLMKVCPKHRCRLEQLKCQSAYPVLNDRFFPLSAMNLADEPNMKCENWEIDVAKLVCDYLTFPYNMSRPNSFNLEIAMKNKNYLTVSSVGQKERKELTFNQRLLEKDMVSLFGVECLNKYYGTKRWSMAVMRSVLRMEQALPDRYIFLQLLVGLSARDLLSEEPIKDELYQKMLALLNSGQFISAKQAEEQLGLKLYEIKGAIRLYRLPQFWVDKVSGKSKVAKKNVITIRLFDEELEEIDQVRKECGSRCIGNFMLECTTFVVEKAKTASELWV